MNDLVLDDGSRIGIIGGGPAGSLFAYFLLSFARHMDLKLQVDIYEARDFTKPGPAGCNMCGGIVSEQLVQALSIEGISLPANIVQRGIDSYVLHTDEDSVKVATPLKEMRIAAIHRGGGPRDVKMARWGGLDGHLLGLAGEMGARIIHKRVGKVNWNDGRPQVDFGLEKETYDLLVGATGVNSSGWDLFENLGIPSQRPKTTKTFITEVRLGEETINQYFGSSMNLFFMNIPRLDCAAIIPKGEYVTVCLLGKDIDKELINTFFESPVVKRCFPPDWDSGEGVCHCSPKINTWEAAEPFMDRLVLVGDCGATRLYKDGIGAAYRTAKAAARTAIFSGVSAESFRKYYAPVYRNISGDNRYGYLIFAVVHWMKALRPVLRGVMRMSRWEQAHDGEKRHMSMVLWDMFTGSAPYREIFFRTLYPQFLARLASSVISATLGRWRMFSLLSGAAPGEKNRS